MLLSIESLVLLNLAFCLTRTVLAFKNKRLITVAWILITYHSLFLVLLGMDGTFTRYKGFTGDFVKIGENIIYDVSVYVIIFNILFAVGEIATFKLFKPASASTWELSTKNVTITKMKRYYGAFLVVGAIWYGIKMQGLGYRDYVEYVGSNWAIVFLWAGSPFVTLSMLQKKYIVTLLMITPFLLFAFYLNIRSFLLLSLIPAFIILFFQMIVNMDGDYIFKRFAVVVSLSAVLVLVSATIMYQKVGKIDLPDSGLVYGMNIVFDAESRHQEWYGFNSLKKYSVYIVNPFIKLASITGVIEYPDIVDTPVYMARMIDGVPLDSDVYFHYPTLWYTDAYVSFAWLGLWLAIFWGFVISVFECIMSRNTIVLGLVLPFYSWHIYMLIRGAIAGAAVPFSYAFYVTVFVYIFVNLTTKRNDKRKVEKIELSSNSKRYFG